MQRALSGISSLGRAQSFAKSLGNNARILSQAAGGDVKFEITPFLGHKTDVPPAEASSNGDELMSYFQQMYSLRRMEMEADALYLRGLVRGFCHLYNGQEAVVVGIEAAIEPSDSLITSYRNHCQQVARGGTVESVLAELTGRTNGASKGKGGSMHLYDRGNNYFGGNGIVGAQTPLGAGLAFAHQYSGDGGVALTMFGDGAANQGQLYEAINMASLWKLPVLFVCENNQYGMGTSKERAAASPDFYSRVDFCPGIKIDGMDVLAVREGFKFAADYARSGNGPMYIEVDTYRYKGHSISDKGLGYRSIDEINVVRQSRDPIDKVKVKLIDNGWATKDELKKEEKRMKKEIDEAVKKAETGPIPQDTDIFNDVYIGDQPFIRGTLRSNGNRPAAH